MSPRFGYKSKFSPEKAIAGKVKDPMALVRWFEKEIDRTEKTLAWLKRTHAEYKSVIEDMITRGEL